MPGGARFEQGGETVFVLGADAGGGGIRVLRWEGDPPFGRSDPVQDRITVTSATHFTPAAAGAPQVLLSQGTLSAGGTEITDANARLVSGGVAIEASEVSITPQGGLNLGGANLVINGAGVAATGVSVPSGTGFTATGVSLNVGGAEVQAGRLVVENGTVLLENLVVTDSHGNTATLVTGTIQPGENGGRPVVTGTTADGQTVVVDAGELEYDYPPDAPLPAGRGERLADGQGLNFATGAVVQGRADLFFSSGRVEADGGLRDMGAVPVAPGPQAPADGYGTNPLPVQDLINHVLVAQLANDRYAKILVRAGTTEAQLYFDWVYNPSQSNVLSRGRRYPTRAKISYEAKLYNRDASGDTMLQSGVENMAEVRVDSTRLFSNGASLEAHLAPRISTDRQVDGQTMVMDRVGITYFRPNDFEISLGDLSGEFTRYTLYQSLAGLRAWRNFSMGPAGAARLTAITGPRWRSGAGFNADGWVTGLRLSTDDVRDLGPLLEDLVVGANLVRSYTGKSNRLSSTVLSFDAAARLKGGLGLLGEWAVSRARQGGQESHGEARLLRAAYRWGALRLVMDRERVSPGFRTVSGSATTDQERTNLWVRLRPNDWSSLNLNFLHTRDNLGGSKAYTTRMDVPRLGISVSPFYPILDRGFLRNLTVALLLSETDRDSDDAGHTINRMSRMLSLSLIQRMGDLYLTLGHDNSRDLDYAASGTSRRGNALDLSLRWRPRYALLGIPMSPIVGVRRGRDNYTGPNGPVSGKISSQRVGLDIGDESILGVELGYELLDNERTDLGGYNRRILNVDLNRILDGEGTRTVGLSYRLLTNDQESGARSYTEGQLTGSVSQRF